MDTLPTTRLTRDEADAPLNLADFAAEAQSIVAEARPQAAEILADAGRQKSAQNAADDAATTQATRDAAYSEGLRQGRDEAMRHVCAQGEQAAALARKIADELTGHRDALAARLAGEALEFSIELARKIVHRVSVKDPTVACENLHKALALCAGRPVVTVHVDPGQREVLQRFCGQFVRELGRGGQVRLVGDDTVSPGGVRVVTSGGRVDATIETQLARVVEALLGPSDHRADEGTYVSETKVRSDVSL